MHSLEAVRYVATVLPAATTRVVLAHVTNELSELFTDLEANPLYRSKIHSIREWVADKQQYKLAQHLFALEDELNPTDIFLWSAIFQNLGALANHADKTAERLRRMLAR